MDEQSVVIHMDAEFLAGEPVFIGTRVPLKNLFDYIRDWTNKRF